MSDAGRLSTGAPPFARFAAGEPLSTIPDDAPPKFREAPLYEADADLATAVELALELRQPLLITGETGCGKTAAAYWAAWQLGLGPRAVHHVQIRSSATAADLKYEFDNVAYLRDAKAVGNEDQQRREADYALRRRCVREGPLWIAFEAARHEPIVLLLDEVDKAPRDLPNDLLHEFDELEFEVLEVLDGGRPLKVQARPSSGPAPRMLIVFTSNGERCLPDAFLRRCVHAHVKYSEDRMARIVQKRLGAASPEAHALGLPSLSDELLKLAVQRFFVLKQRPDLNHPPGLAELLLWIRALASRGGLDEARLKDLKPVDFPLIGLLIKDPDDLHRVRSR
jgi:MoxR-like ATPase